MKGKFSLKISLPFILLFQNGLWKIIKVMVSMVNAKHGRCYKCRKIIKGKNSKPYYLIITIVPLRYTRLLSRVQLFLIPWTVACHAPLSMDSPEKNTGVGCCSLLQEIFPIQGLKPRHLCFLHCWQILYRCTTIVTLRYNYLKLITLSLYIYMCIFNISFS